MKESLTNGERIFAVDDEPDVLTASEEEKQRFFISCQFESAAFYEPAVDMKEWV